ncbi:hypothetical protein ACS0TY_003616 [Phlomoides rotata]
MEQYEMASGNKILKEFTVDFESKNKVIKCSTYFPWERQFQKAYTNSIFKQVQVEIQRMLYCHLEPVVKGANSDGIEQFKVLERSIVNNFYLREFTYTVKYRTNGSHISCDCKKFGFKGILCCHIMKVMAQKDIQIVNERYLLRRWRKDVFRRHSKCVDVAMDDVSKMEFIKRKCIEMKSELLNWNPEMAISMSVSTDTTSVDVGCIPDLDPRITNSQGRSRNNRYLLSRETNTRGCGVTGSRRRGGEASSSTRGRPRGSGVPRGGRGREGEGKGEGLVQQ